MKVFSRDGQLLRISNVSESGAAAWHEGELLSLRKNPESPKGAPSGTVIRDKDGAELGIWRINPRQLHCVDVTLYAGIEQVEVSIDIRA